MSFEYTRSDFKDITMRNNRLRTADGTIVPYYDVKAEFQNAVANIDTTSPDMKRWFNKLDVFNVFNSDDYTAVSTVQYGAAAYNRPSVVLQGRIIRIGADVRW